MWIKFPSRPRCSEDLQKRTRVKVSLVQTALWSGRTNHTNPRHRVEGKVTVMGKGGTPGRAWALNRLRGDLDINSSWGRGVISKNFERGKNEDNRRSKVGPDIE